MAGSRPRRSAPTRGEAAVHQGRLSARAIVSRSTSCIRGSAWSRLRCDCSSIDLNAARRIRTCNQGIQGPSRFHEAWTISSSSCSRTAIPSGNESRACLMRAEEEAGRSWRGLLLGLTPLVSEPSWPPMPGQAWLRIAMPRESPRRFGRWPSHTTNPPCRNPRFRFPAIHPVRSRRLPSVATFFDESPALPLS